MGASAMNYPKDYKDFIKYFSFKDSKEIYTNGSELIPVFRVKQMLEYYFTEHIPLLVKNKERFDKWDVDGWYLGRSYKGLCPRCGEKVYEENNACPECGQLLKWY